MHGVRTRIFLMCATVLVVLLAAPSALSAAGRGAPDGDTIASTQPVRPEQGGLLRPVASGVENGTKVSLPPVAVAGFGEDFSQREEDAARFRESAPLNPGWAIVANIWDGTLVTYDMSTAPPTMHGPFLAGQLGGLNIGSMAVAPGGRYAVIPGGNNTEVYRVGLTNPAAPTLDACVDVTFLPMAVAISPDGTYALVTGLETNQLAVIDLSSFTLKTVLSLQTPNAGLTCVSIAPDNTTWVAGDVNNRVIYGTYSLAGGFSAEQVLPASGFPMQVGISPDGQTVIVATIYVYTVDIYQITAPGTLVSKGTVATPGGTMSVAYTADGSKAYLYSRSLPLNGNVVSWLSVAGPGSVSMGGSGVAKPFPYSGTVWVGLYSMALSTDGSTLAIMQEYENPVTDTRIGLVNTSGFAVSYVDPGTSDPTGVATFLAAPPCPAITVAATPSVFPLGEAGIPYGPITFSAAGGAGPYSFILSCGSSPLPPGLTLGPDGTLSGTPTAPGTYPFSVTAIDGNGCTGSASFSLTMGSFGLCLFDDGGVAKLCVDTGTGAYRYSILTGKWAGKLFTGMGTYTTAYGVGTFRTKSTDPNQILAYDYFGARAYVRFSNKVQMVALQYYDSNLGDDPACP